MKVFNENDFVRLVRPVEAFVAGERRHITAPAGAEGTIVLVHGSIEAPKAYEVEFEAEAVGLDDPFLTVFGVVAANDIELLWSPKSRKS